MRFKEFLNEDIVPQKFNPRISDKQFDSIVKTARFMVDNGYADNFIKMSDLKKYILRGSNYHKELINDSGMIGMVDPKRTVNRKSVFSTSQFIFNVWHIFKMPSRKRATIASTSLNMANDFGAPFIFVPEQGVKIHLIPEDWNIGFKDQVAKVFGSHLKFGEMSYVFKGFTQLRRAGAQRYETMFKMFDQDHEITSIKALKDLCDELDIFLRSTDIATIRNYIQETPLIIKVIINLVKSVQEQDESSFDLLFQLMKFIKPLIEVNTDITKILTRSTEESEMWWTGNSFIIPFKDGDVIVELQNVVKQLIGK